MKWLLKTRSNPNARSKELRAHACSYHIPLLADALQGSMASFLGTVSQDKSTCTILAAEKGPTATDRDIASKFGKSRGDCQVI